MRQGTGRVWQEQAGRRAGISTELRAVREGMRGWGPAVPGALQGRDPRCGLPRRVLGPAGGCDPSPRAAWRRGSRYRKHVQECCFCLETLSRSNGASKTLTQSCSLCLWSRSCAKRPHAQDTMPYSRPVLAGAAGAQVAALPGSAMAAMALALPVAAARSERLPALHMGHASPWQPELCSLRPGAVSPAQDADSLWPCFPLPPHSCLVPHTKRASDAVRTPGPALCSCSPPVPCPALWVPRYEAATVAAGCPLAILLLRSPTTFATPVHPMAAAVGPPPWPATAVLPPWLAPTPLSCTGGTELGRVSAQLWGSLAPSSPPKPCCWPGWHLPAGDL